jgi:hypothetical protein
MFSIALQLTAPAAVFRAVHGDPATWTTAEFDGYLDACDMQAAAPAAAGQNDACPLCGYWTCRCTGFDSLEFDSVAGQDALADIIDTLAQDAATELDAEDLDHYRGLLLAPVTRLADHRTTESARGWAA